MHNFFRRWFFKFFMFEISRTRIDPGDVIVIQVGAWLSAEDNSRILDEASQAFPNNRIIVLGKEANLKVVSGAGDESSLED